VPSVLNDFDFVDSREIVDVRIQPEGDWTLVGAIAGVGVDIDAQRHLEILEHSIISCRREAILEEGLSVT
jgi:hypothetical protein